MSRSLCFAIALVGLTTSVAHAQDQTTTPDTTTTPYGQNSVEAGTLPVTTVPPVRPEPALPVPHLRYLAGGMPDFAFLMEVRISGGGTLLGTSGSLGVLQPSITLGVRLAGRLHLGVGFSLTHLSTNQATTNSAGVVVAGSDVTLFTLVPSVSIDLVRSRDRRVAFYLKLGVPLGARLQDPPGNRFVTGYDAALGTRYAPHHMFAVGFEAGINGMYIDPSGNDPYNVAVVYGSVVGTFFGGRARRATLVHSEYATD